MSWRDILLLVTAFSPIYQTHDLAYRRGMSGTAKAGIVVIGSVLAMATLGVYWTRTPQYALLRVLEKHSGPGQERTRAHIAKPNTGKQLQPLQQRTEPVTQYLAYFQNKTLGQTYGVRVTDARIEGKRAVLTVTLSTTVYTIPFHEEPDGHWALGEFQNREKLLKEVSERKEQSLVSIIARL